MITPLVSAAGFAALTAPLVTTGLLATAALAQLIDSQREANFWNPVTQLRRVKKTSIPPRPDGAPNRGLELVQVEPSEGEAA